MNQFFCHKTLILVLVWALHDLGLLIDGFDLISLLMVAKASTLYLGI